MPALRSSRRLASTRSPDPTANAPASMSRPRRSNGASEPNFSASVSRRPSNSDSDLPSMRLKVTLPPSKLRQVTGGTSGNGSSGGRPITQASHRSSGASVSVNSRDQFIGGEILEGKRARNVKKSYVLDSDSEDDEMEDVIEDDEDAEGEDEDMDAEGEDEDADGDVDMDMPPPPPTIKVSPSKPGKVTISAQPTGKPDGMSVERKEAFDDSDDDELSELDSNLDDEEETMQLGGEEDAEGEDEDAEGEEIEEEEEEVEEVEEEEEEEELDSDDETPGGGSRGSTPDLTKLTKRQRARLEEGGSGHLLALPDEVQVKKHLTAEEHAMRRAEMARRRKNLSEKRNEEEKMETINKLLKKQAPKTNARRKDLGAAGEVTPLDEAGNLKPNPVYVRWVNNKDGSKIGVPEEWLDGPIGKLFVNAKKAPSAGNGRLVEVVQD